MRARLVIDARMRYRLDPGFLGLAPVVTMMSFYLYSSLPMWEYRAPTREDHNIGAFLKCSEGGVDLPSTAQKPDPRALGCLAAERGSRPRNLVRRSGSQYGGSLYGGPACFVVPERSLGE